MIALQLGVGTQGVYLHTKADKEEGRIIAAFVGGFISLFAIVVAIAAAITLKTAALSV